MCWRPPTQAESVVRDGSRGLAFEARLTPSGSGPSTKDMTQDRDPPPRSLNDIHESEDPDLIKMYSMP